MHPPSGGTIPQRRGHHHLKPYQRIRSGISVKFQVPGIFAALSVRQNLTIALQHHLDGRLARESPACWSSSAAAAADMQAGSLSHGQKQWLEIGMAIGVKPRLLLLDEPTAGMSPEETYKTGEMSRAERRGITVLAVEHDMAFVRQIAKRVTVLHFGQIFAQGTVEEITANEAVAEIYLGRAHAG